MTHGLAPQRWRWIDAHCTLAHNGNSKMGRYGCAPISSRHRACQCRRCRRVCEPMHVAFCRCCNLPPFRFKIVFFLVSINIVDILEAYCRRYTLAFLFSQSLVRSVRANVRVRKYLCDFPLHFYAVHIRKNGEKLFRPTSV